ncbi:MAG: hypothetical protein UX42_C0001G0011 [Microgenomates group bacterium GW2011_GWC1_46_20]|nr:MAG: hypothetical protein UX42_C0001G0011 [Microgenomates group bacterium GW2011_GWC1_46_20]
MLAGPGGRAGIGNIGDDDFAVLDVYNDDFPIFVPVAEIWNGRYRVWTTA